MYHIEFRRAALRVYDYLGSLRQASKTMHVSIASLSRWSRRLAPKGRVRSSKLTSAMEAVIEALVKASACITCREIQAELWRIFQIAVSRQLVHVAVHRMGFSWKRTRKRGVPRPGAKSVSKEDFVRRYLSIEPERPIVALDESGFDQRSRPLYGYSRRGQPAVLKVVANSDRRRMNLLMAVDTSGASFMTLSDKATKGPGFAAFIQSLPHPAGAVMVLDNAAFHKTQEVVQVAKSKGYVLMYLPPYTPEFNAIELVFGVVKQDFYRRRYNDFQSGLESAVRRSIAAKALPSTIKGCFRHVHSLMATCTKA